MVAKISALYQSAFFCNELARLFKLPTMAPVVNLCSQMIEAETTGESDQNMAGLPDWAIESFDVFCSACRALRALACPRPYPLGSKCATEMFAPKDASVLVKGVADLANSVQMSPLWCRIMEAYWGAAANDDRLADAFNEAVDSLDTALEENNLVGAVTAINKANVMQDWRRDVACSSKCS